MTGDKLTIPRELEGEVRRLVERHAAQEALEQPPRWMVSFQASLTRIEAKIDALQAGTKPAS